MAKVLVVYAGGTVGMLSSSNGYKPDKNFAEVLASLLANQVEEEFPRCDVVSMTRLIDSANVQVSDWKLLGELLINNWDEYDAFVVLHGTDTMAY
ncbi:MAG: asparaginase domain-containing protein, partial [Pontibacterium sp.]